MLNSYALVDENVNFFLMFWWTIMLTSYAWADEYVKFLCFGGRQC